MKATITNVELSLAIVNKNLATFNVNGVISGVVHLPSSGPVTVVIDGGSESSIALPALLNTLVCCL